MMVGGEDSWVWFYTIISFYTFPKKVHHPFTYTWMAHPVVMDVCPCHIDSVIMQKID